MNPAAPLPPTISYVGLRDLWSVNLLLNANLSAGTGGGGDWLTRSFGLLAMPPLLLFSGRGYQARLEQRLAGVVYVNQRRQSGYIFNLVTAAGLRRRGVARALLRYAAVESLAAQRRWLGLYVEAPNLGARQLYEAEGYRYYRAQGWRGRLAEPDRNDVALQVASPFHERSLLKQFRDQELTEGDRWAATVVAADYAPTLPTMGRLYRCLYQGELAGVLWARSGERKPRLTAELFVDPIWWHDEAWLAALLSAMAERWGSGRLVDLFPGSGDHWGALAPALRSAGFSPLERHRLLMLKPLTTGAP